jgi:hypothetical protein
VAICKFAEDDKFGIYIAVRHLQKKILLCWPKPIAMKKNATILKKMSFTVLLGAILLSACTQKENNSNDAQMDNTGNDENALTRSEKEEGWQLLFDGKSMENFRGFRKDEVPSAWKVEDGAIAFAGGRGGDLITKDQYKNFDFSIDWKISEGGNSGIMYHVSEDTAYHNTYNSGPEMQVLDDERHPDAKEGVNGNRRAGALYDLIPLSTPAVKPAGQWNTARLLVKDGHVEHWLNGKKVVEYEIGSPKWDSLIQQSKFASMKGFGREEQGHIALQDHGNKVWFRNIKIRVI